jgi:Zn-dependent oligopeptidase
MQQCGAKTRDGTACRKPPIAGGSRCRLHGGATPAALAKAQERLALARATKALADLGGAIEPIVDPFSALEELAGWSYQLTDILRQRVAQLQQLRFKSDQGFEQVAGELTAFMSMLARSESILAKIVSLGIAERRQRLDELQLKRMSAALDRALSNRDVALTSEQQRRLRQALVRELDYIDSTVEDV